MHVHMNTLDSFQLAAENSLFSSSDIEGFRTLSLPLWVFRKRGNRALLIIRANELQADSVGDTWVSE